MDDCYFVAMLGKLPLAFTIAIINVKLTECITSPSLLCFKVPYNLLFMQKFLWRCKT